MRRGERSPNGSWLRTVVASGIVLAVGLYASLAVTLFSGWPRPSTEAGSVFAMVFATAWIAGRFAPSAKEPVALASAILASLIGVGMLDYALLPCLAGAFVATAWTRARRPPSATPGDRFAARVAGTAALVGLLLFSGYVYSLHVDWPAVPDPMPSRLGEILGEDASRVKAFFETDLGGFIDRESLWRIETDSETVVRLVEQLELVRVDEIPAAFFHQPPRDWFHAFPTGGEAYASEGFRAEERGPDGDQFFLVHDGRGRACLWLKSNF